MNLESIFTKYPHLKTYLIPLILGLLGLALIVCSLIGSSIQKSQKPSISFDQSILATTSANISSKDIAVDVEGAVMKPGLFRISQDSRVQDALIAAGGMTQDADRDYVSKHVNLALKLIDGAKIYIPKKGDTSQDQSIGQGDTNNNSGQVVNINTSSLSDLDALPGVGLTTAQKIISGRPYSDINELQTKKIINSKVFSQIKDKITAE